MKEALFWKSEAGAVRCGLCCRRCLIPEGGVGVCRVRQNKGGRLYSLVYGKASSIGIDPIEKKPLFHFAPGSLNLSVSTVGCNFRCSFCCNYAISQEWEGIRGEDAPPEKLVAVALENGLHGMAYTYTEPTIFFEYAQDTALLAKKKGLYNIFVTNGYTTPEAIRKASSFLDAAVIDLKSSLDPDFYRKQSMVPDVQPIYDAMMAYKENGVFFEVTDLIMPESDIKRTSKVCRWIADNLGPDVPLHFIQFFPSYKVCTGRTDVSMLDKAYEAAKKEGLNYVYLGNVPGNVHESTMCPSCGRVVIERFGSSLVSIGLKAGKCGCGQKIPLAGMKWSLRKQFPSNK
ncbi:MAG: AmmeMemoRadiSam system radical SAM enzyme [Candidatus Aenigmatarchaeota archaeon]